MYYCGSRDWGCIYLGIFIYTRAQNHKNSSFQPVARTNTLFGKTEKRIQL